MRCFNCYFEFSPTLVNPICPSCGFCYYCREFACFHHDKSDSTIRKFRFTQKLLNHFRLITTLFSEFFLEFLITLWKFYSVETVHITIASKQIIILVQLLIKIDKYISLDTKPLNFIDLIYNLFIYKSITLSMKLMFYFLLNKY